MPSIVTSPQGQFPARPIKNALIPPEGPKSVNIVIPFASGVNTQYLVDFTLFNQRSFITTVQAIYVDNSQNTSDSLSLTVETTGQRLVWPAGFQGYLPILAPETPKFLFESNGSSDVQVAFVNVPVPAQIWGPSGSSSIPNPLPVDIVSPATLPVSGDWLTDAELRASNIGVTTTPADATSIIGRGGNIATRIVNTPTVTAGAYTTGQVIGGLLTLSNALRTSVLTGLIQSVSLTTLTTQTTPIDVIFFSDNPTASTITNGVALAVNSADVGKVAAIANLFSPSQLGTPSLYFSGGLAVPVIGAATTIYAAIVARGSLTLGSTSDVSLITRIVQD